MEIHFPKQKPFKPHAYFSMEPRNVLEIFQAVEPKTNVSIVTGIVSDGKTDCEQRKRMRKNRLFLERSEALNITCQPSIMDSPSGGSKRWWTKDDEDVAVIICP
ncbi:hypothetical protein TNCV_2070151 [Trichonephila clavipes]|uniref:Uncharacterized protein n=1 Tax=Trichonephila clavipes TaxID=2585209 RepID=A0A8X6W331_TRICX|nr:hypothetical protein TNCV_2070151 [Trichonephila clavipes]